MILTDKKQRILCFFAAASMLLCGCTDISDRTITTDVSTADDFSGIGGDLLKITDDEGNKVDGPLLNHDFSPAQQAFINSCCFMGDSICYGLNSYGLVNVCYAKAGVAARNIFEYTFTQGNTEVEPLTVLANAGKKNLVFFMGTNDVNIETSDQFIEFYDDFLTRVEGICPDASIYVLSIPPVTEDSEFCYNYTIDEFNIKLKDMITESGKPSRHYVDIGKSLRTDAGALDSTYSLSDGVHLTKAAYYNLLSDFCKGAGVE